MRKISILLATAGVVASAQMSYGADLPVKAPVYKAPPPIALYNWNGFYVGANVGFGWSNVDSTSTNLTTGAVGSGSTHRDGILGGGQVGFNYLVTPNVLLGVEGDFDGADITGSGGSCRDATHCSNSDGKTEWLATVRGRVGYVMNDWLIFATGGGAWTHGTSTRTVTAGGGGPVPLSASVSPTHSGWTVGGGLEYGFARNWSAKLEYLYMQTKGSEDYTYSFPNYNVHVDSTGHINVVRFGVNYHFN